MEECIKRLEDFLEEVTYLLRRYEVLKEDYEEGRLTERSAKEFKALKMKIRKCGKRIR